MDVTELIDACREAAGGDTPTRGVSELVAAFVHQPNLANVLGDGDRSTYEALYRGEDIVVLHGVVPPTPVPVAPHNHRMWAVIGVYQAREHNELRPVRQRRARKRGSLHRRRRRRPHPRCVDHPLGAGTWRSLPRRDPRLRRRSLRDPAEHVERQHRVPDGRIGATGLLRPAAAPRDRTRTCHETRRDRDLPRWAGRAQLSGGRVHERPRGERDDRDAAPWGVDDERAAELRRRRRSGGR